MVSSGDGIGKILGFVRSPISIVGAALTTISAVVFLVVFLADLFGLHSNPYIGILFFLILPAIFLAGLLLIPLGIWRERRRRRAGKPPSELHWPRIDLNDPGTRRTTVAVLALTFVNVVIVSLAAYKGVEYMDSVAFCGQVCHTVMQPEGVAHAGGPHRRVACVECHIGAGAASFARSKVSGARQLVALSFNSYSRPIPVPVENLRPARDTCEQCHWPGKYRGDRTVRVSEYGDDEKNSLTVTTLQLHLGGGGEAGRAASGIHSHADAGNVIEYIATDDQRQTIPYVRVQDRTGAVREYVAEGTTPEQLAGRERRRMDCIDCHNRAGHQLAASAERAVDAAIAQGDIPMALPFVRREAVRILKVSHQTEATATESIATALRDFYRVAYPAVYSSRRGEVEKAVSGTQQIYRRNVFPMMNVKFGTYPDNAGHMDFPGCFRCHDENHKTRDGKTISQDCETCHAIE